MQRENLIYEDPECQSALPTRPNRKPLGPLAEIKGLRRRPQGFTSNANNIKQEDKTLATKPVTSSTTNTTSTAATKITTTTAKCDEQDDDLTCDFSLDTENDDDNVLNGIKLNDENSFDYGPCLDDIGEDEMMVALSDYNQTGQSLVNFDVSFVSKCDDYADEIESYLCKLERAPSLRPSPDCMSKQDDLTSTMRSILVDWLFEVSDEHKLHHETFFLAVNMVDRFLSVMHVDKSSFQLLGAAALFTASKYEDIYPPDVHQFSEATDWSSTAPQIIQMEQLLLRVIQFRVSVPTPYYFLTKIFASTTRFSQRTYHLAQYLCYLTLLEDQPFLEYYPSEIAIAATILAAHQLESSDLITDKLMTMFKQSLSNQLERNRTKVADRRNRIGATERKLPLCIEALHSMQEYAPMHNQKAIYDKFSSHEYDCVSNLKSVLDVRKIILEAMQ